MIYMRYFGYIFAVVLSLVSLRANAQYFEVDHAIFERDSVLPVFSTIVDLPDDYYLYDYSAEIEFPEFVPMKSDEIARYGLNAVRDSLPAYPRVSSNVGVSAKRGQLDVAFVPIVYANDKFLRVNSFKLVVKRTPLAMTQNRMASRTSAAERYVQNSLLASGRWVKIRVSDGGVYKITHSELSRMGFKNPDKVRLYGYGGRILPETNIHELPDDLCEVPLWREDNYMLFYAYGTIRWEYKSGRFVHSRNVYSRYGYYFITESEEQASDFPRFEQSASATMEYDTYPDYALYENDAITLCTYGSVMLDSYNYLSGRTANYKFDIEGVADERATVDVSFGSDATASSSVAVEVNGTPVGSLSVPTAGNMEHGRISNTTLAVSSGFSDNPTVRLTHNVQNNALSGYLDYIRINFTRKLEMRSSCTAFRGCGTGGNALYKIASSDADTRVWRITDEKSIALLDGSLDTGVLSVVAPASRNEEFVAINVKGSFPSVEIVGEVANQNLHAMGHTDMVIIVPSNGSFIKDAERLARAHSLHDGISAAVVTAEQVYNEFSSGTPDATAYRRLMKMLYDRAQSPSEAPKYLLLFGDGLTDNRLITYPRRKQQDFLLTYQSENSVSAVQSYVLEDYYGFLDDGEGASHVRDKVDVAVGRLPVQTQSDAAAVVDKIIAYMENADAGAWQNVVALLADDGDKAIPNQHMKDAESVAGLFAEGNRAFMLDRIYWDDYPMEVLATGNSYPQVTKAIYDRLDAGALVVNYSGHGSANLLSHEMAWKASDMAAISSPRVPFWVTASCDIAPFDMGDGSLGESAMLNPSGGAVGLFTTTRTVLQVYNAIINRRFMGFLMTLNDDGTVPAVGDAMRKAKCAVIADGSDLSVNKLQYILIGDPALRLQMPCRRVVVEAFNGRPVDVMGQVSAGGNVLVEGYVADVDGSIMEGFNGIISPTLFDCIEEVRTRDNTGLGAYSYTAYRKKLFSGSDSVVNGRFSLSIPVPMDISYSDEIGMLNLFAIDSGGTSAQGFFDGFLVGGTSPTLSDDGKGPEITMYLNSASFIDGDEVNATPCLFVELYDENGINTVGTGVGHDITAIIDNNEDYTYNLNGLFKPVVGDHRRGTIEFPLDELPAGEHTLLLRAWDLFNNSSADTLYFSVVPHLAPDFVDVTATPNPVRYGETVRFALVHDRPHSNLDVTIELFDFQGRILWRHSGSAAADGNIYTVDWNVTLHGGQPMPTGVYLYRAKLSSGGSEEQTKTRKIIVINNK